MLFCALRPPPEVTADLFEQMDWLEPGDDRVEPERLHVTLAPVASSPRVSASLISRAGEACASLSSAAFRIVFDELIVADRVLLRPGEAIPSLMRFQRDLMNCLADARLVSPKDYKFSPHLTLSYRSRTCRRPFFPPTGWMVRDFVLVESLRGERRQIERGRWPLHARS